MMEHPVLQTVVKIRCKLENTRYIAGEITGKLEINAETHQWLKDLVAADIVDSQLLAKGKSVTIEKLQVTDPIIAEVTLYTTRIVGAFYFESINQLIDNDCTKLPILPYYIHNDSYFSTDPTEPESIGFFRKVISLVDLLAGLCDYVEDVDGQYSKLTFFAKNKISFETKYTSNQLNKLEELERLKDHFITSHDADQRKTVFKTELVNFLYGQPENLMFGALVYSFSELVKNYEVAYAIYIEQFSYIDIKNQVDKDKLDYVKKIAAVVSDVQSKLIAVPAAYLAIVALVDFKAGFTFKNNIIIVAGVMFATILELLITSQSSILSYTKKEIAESVKLIKEKTNANFLQEFVESLESVLTSIKRQNIYLVIFRLIVWSVPVILLIFTWIKAGS